MKFCKSTKLQRDTKELLKEVNKCRPEELEKLLQKIQSKIEQSQEKDIDFLSAKTIITSRIASMKSENI